MEERKVKEDGGMGCHPRETRFGGKESRITASQQEADGAIPYTPLSAYYFILGYYHCQHGEDTIDRKVTHAFLFGYLCVTVIF